MAGKKKLNYIILYPDHAKIILNHNQICYIDKEDCKKINQHTWFADKSGYTFYARTTINNKKIRMHRLIMPTHNLIDHIDHNGLNNRKYNLRQCSHRENIRYSPNKTGGNLYIVAYRGIVEHKNGWRVLVLMVVQNILAILIMKLMQREHTIQLLKNIIKILAFLIMEFSNAKKSFD